MLDVNPWVSVTHQGNITDYGLHIECEVRDPQGVECEESKLAKMACSGFLAPHCVNSNCVRAEVTYCTEHAHHQVFFWSRVALCRTPVWASPKKVAALLLVPAEFIGSPTKGENIAWLLLWLLH